MSDTPDSAEPTQASAGQFRAEDAGDRTMAESRPRRVLLRRDVNGSYCIFMGGRMIQGFCSEFEDITGFAIVQDSQVQVRINIERLGQVRRAAYPERELLQVTEESLETRIRVSQERDENLVEGRPLFSSAHPGNPTVTQTWQDEAREHLVKEIERRQDLINLLAEI